MASDFTKHNNPDRKEAYLARHKKNEDHGLRGAKTAGFWSANVLWNKPTLKASIGDINKMFKSLKVKMKKNNLHIYIYRVMDKLPSNIIQHTYEYDNTYKIKLDKVLKQMMAHCFIYNCHKCFKPWNNC